MNIMTTIVKPKVREIETYLRTLQANAQHIGAIGATTKNRPEANIVRIGRTERGVGHPRRSHEATGSGRGLRSFA